VRLTATTRLGLLLLAVLSLAVRVPASAAAPSFGTPVAVCAQRLAALPSGRVYGAGDCGSGPRLLVSDSGRPWRTAAALWAGYRVESLAVDGTAPFVVVSCDRREPPCKAGSGPRGRGFFIGKVPHGGSRSALTRLGSSQLDDSADVVATGGHWFAAWTQSVLDNTGRLLSTLEVGGAAVGGCAASKGIPTSSTAARGVGPVAFLGDRGQQVATTR
jgi:hypothetical protein